MLSEAEFHIETEATLEQLLEAIEENDADGELDVELHAGMLTIDLPNGKQYLVSKHAPSRQLWVSSPISGGLHFSWNERKWVLPDGRELEVLVSEEVKQLANAA